MMSGSWVGKQEIPSWKIIFHGGILNPTVFYEIPPLKGRLHRNTPNMLLGSARGLLALHERGFIHRDVKSANIFVFTQDDGEIPTSLGSDKMGGPMRKPFYLEQKLGPYFKS